MSPQTYTTAQVAYMSAVTPRQLQWWDEHGLISPPQQGHRRVYDEQRLFGVLLFRELKERGFSLAVIRKLWRQMEKKGFVAPRVDEQRWMLTDGKRVVFLVEPDSVLAFLEQRRNPTFVLVSLTTLAKRMAEQAQLLPDRVYKRGPGKADSPYAGYLAGEAKRA